MKSLQKQVEFGQKKAMKKVGNKTSTLSNTAEIVENESSYKLSPLQSNDFARELTSV